ncbi:sigma-70 family RNA polymerase sigma factor [Lysinibacillus piscis]|uniref:Sigma-70 family RNA polymerase sigma factor n=1 Tax=Lysinibacillus piscis TaxID=2518931 RepID=A0ABQ5NIZ8_9BACI|nr:sigma-70 family RNA polymerase sigma factor [Lysinibacillus sp. KH24]GLC88344.1 hypothetical protein LYSBPC_14710 [Lysinibacillus sp. KH24]
MSKQPQLFPEQPFEELLQAVQPMITAICVKCRIYKEHDYYRQIASIAAWEAWKKADCSKGVFSSYVYTSIRGAILNELSKERISMELYTPTMDDTLYFLYQEYYEQYEEQTEYAMEQLLSALSEEEKIILFRWYMEGYSYIEIAKELQLSVEAVKKRSIRMRAKLQKWRRNK